MQAKPQTKASELVGQLNRFRDIGVFLDKSDFVWLKLKRECESVRNIEPGHGWAMLGMAYALVGDIEEVDNSFANAFRYQGTMDVKQNWFASLASLGLYSRSHQMYAEIGDPKLGVFTPSTRTGINVGAFQMVTQNLQAAQRMGMDTSAFPVADIEEIASILSDAGLTDADVAQHLDAAGEVLRERGLFEVRSPEIRSSRHEAGGFSGVTMILYVTSTPTEVMSYNKALARKEREREVKRHLAFDVVIASAE